ncbi:hypothetical protein P8C59_008181 [Phyllachora maydis]|uniref:Uncharacterized protein n=1 Tax=Phyllachora maydis TaxID=1825666 RepID=A0AAD9IBP6_9PEZI|nr:hypothetical protein P8C59_008181 [Phyllachora maydis]
MTVPTSEIATNRSRAVLCTIAIESASSRTNVSAQYNNKTRSTDTSGSVIVIAKNRSANIANTSQARHPIIAAPAPSQSTSRSLPASRTVSTVRVGYSRITAGQPPLYPSVHLRDRRQALEDHSSGTLPGHRSTRDQEPARRPTPINTKSSHLLGMAPAAAWVY